MSMFPSISIAGTGLEVDQTWIDAIGGNVANAEDAVTPGQPVYREEEVAAVASPGSGSGSPGNGVQASITLGSSQGILTHDPGKPARRQGGRRALPEREHRPRDDLARRGAGQLRGRRQGPPEQRHRLPGDPRDQGLTPMIPPIPPVSAMTLAPRRRRPLLRKQRRRREPTGFANMLGSALDQLNETTSNADDTRHRRRHRPGEHRGRDGRRHRSPARRPAGDDCPERGRDGSQLDHVDAGRLTWPSLPSTRAS